MATPTSVEAIKLELSRAGAFELLDVIGVLLREEEKLDAFQEFQMIAFKLLAQFQSEIAKLN